MRREFLRDIPWEHVGQGVVVGSVIVVVTMAINKWWAMIEPLTSGVIR